MPGQRFVFIYVSVLVQDSKRVPVSVRDVVGLRKDATLLARLARGSYRDLPYRKRRDRGGGQEHHISKVKNKRNTDGGARSATKSRHVPTELNLSRRRTSSNILQYYDIPGIMFGRNLWNTHVLEVVDGGSAAA